MTQASESSTLPHIPPGRRGDAGAAGGRTRPPDAVGLRFRIFNEEYAAIGKLD